MRQLILAAALLVGPIAANAAPVNLAQASAGYSYYNRPGADLATHDRDVAACVADTAAVHSVYAGEGLIADLLETTFKDGGAAAAVENCMVVRGWRVVRLADAEGKALSQRPDADIAAELGSQVGAAVPRGEVVRAWANDAARASTDRFAPRAKAPGDRLLSLRAAKATKPPSQRVDFKHAAALAESPWGQTTVPAKVDRRWPNKLLKPKALATAPVDAAIIVVGLKGAGKRSGAMMTFNRQGVDPMTSPSPIDGGPDKFTAFSDASADGAFTIVAVPPGKWRIYSMGVAPVLNLCLGSPAFEAKAGEVVYAGLFDLASETMNPDLSLDAARAHLAGAPHAARLRPAAYTNGSLGPCRNNAVYALEITDAPFEEGYTGGSAPTAGEATAAPAS